MTDLPASRGFTLLEVMLAILILGLGLTVFYGAANEGVAVAVQAREYQISRQMLRELDLREPLDLEEVEEGVLTGAFTHPQYGRISWTRSLEAVGEEEDEFFRLTSEVSRGSGKGALRESVETFLHPPSAMRGGWIQEPLDEF